jgi:hypothetical protein
MRGTGHVAQSPKCARRARTVDSPVGACQRGAVGVLLEAEFAKQAKQRQREAGKQHGRGKPKKLVARLPQAKARDAAAKAAGTSPRQVQDAKLMQKPRCTPPKSRYVPNDGPGNC